jgi:hypothetical protein
MSDFIGKNCNVIVSAEVVLFHLTKLYSCSGNAAGNCGIREDESENTWEKFRKLYRYLTAGNE